MRWQKHGFSIETTADGSPTLRGERESMHHSGGALAETLLIYGEPLRELFTQLPRPRVFSLGLGLGYVELVTAQRALLAKKSFELETRESEQILVETFLAWLDGERESFEARVYDGLAGALVATAPGGPGVDDLKESLRTARREQRWALKGRLGSSGEPLGGRFHGLMYDAFSSKTSPELWSEDALRTLLAEHGDQDCLFSTYACTGNLKRSLRAEGFFLELREGFRGKRHSTLGRRGIFHPEGASLAITAQDGQSPAHDRDPLSSH